MVPTPANLRAWLLCKGQGEGPGSRGSHEWYVNRFGKVVYGPMPQHQGKRERGEDWMSELPGNWYYQGEHARYLVNTQDGEVYMQTEAGWKRIGHVGHWSVEDPHNTYLRKLPKHQSQNRMTARTRLNEVMRELGHEHSPWLALTDAQHANVYSAREGTDYIISSAENEMRHKMKQAFGHEDEQTRERERQERYAAALERGEEPSYLRDVAGYVSDEDTQKSHAGGLRDYLAKGKIIEFPGSHGGHGYYNDQGEWVYGERPEPRPTRGKRVKKDPTLDREVMRLADSVTVPPQNALYHRNQHNAAVYLQRRCREMGLQCHLERGLFADYPDRHSWVVVDDPRLSHPLLLQPGSYPLGLTSIKRIGDFTRRFYRPIQAVSSEEGTEKSLRDYLRKSQPTGPGSHGSHKWYVDRHGEVVHGDPPKEYPGKKVGEQWTAEEIPATTHNLLGGRHKMLRGKHGTYLISPLEKKPGDDSHATEVHHLSIDGTQHVGIVRAIGGRDATHPKFGLKQATNAEGNESEHKHFEHGAMHLIYEHEKKLDQGEIQKSHAEGPGSRGSYKWYINRFGKPVYGEKPVPRYEQHKPGEMWEVPELPGHHWYQGTIGRYLFAPTGDVMRHGEGVVESLHEARRKEPIPGGVDDFRNQGRLKAADDLIHVGTARRSKEYWGPPPHRRKDKATGEHYGAHGINYYSMTGHRLSSESSEVVPWPATEEEFGGRHLAADPTSEKARLNEQRWAADAHDYDLQRHIYDETGRVPGQGPDPRRQPPRQSSTIGGDDDGPFTG